MRRSWAAATFTCGRVSATPTSSRPPKGSSGSRASPEQPKPPPGPELRGQAGSAPSIPTGEELPASGEAIATRVALARPSSGSLSASAEKTRRESSSRPSPGQAPEPLPGVLGSAGEVIGQLEAAIAAERAKLKEEHAALVDGRGRLEEARKLLQTRVAMARMAYERSLQELTTKREALEEVQQDAVAAQKEVVLREINADLASSALIAWEESLAIQEARVIAREQAIEARAEQMERAHTEVAAQFQEARVAKDVTANNKGLEAWLKNAEEDLNAVRQERTHVKAMIQDGFRQARGSMEAAGLGSVTVVSQGLDTLGHLALGFSEIARRLEALPATVQELATRECAGPGCGQTHSRLLPQPRPRHPAGANVAGRC
ncbi:uncharacterized protein LOC133888355 [Phragmites australis]|uniref:uncharacterized protein LOC133888355 n=1 Tax=Phragmites australis TaxID=29695 RepID=UPI002D778F12|nr:uncharacterized protein LOC133888355 [Phragmites australis]